MMCVVCVWHGTCSVCSHVHGCDTHIVHALCAVWHVCGDLCVVYMAHVFVSYMVCIMHMWCYMCSKYVVYCSHVVCVVCNVCVMYVVCMTCVVFFMSHLVCVASDLYVFCV